MHPCMADMLGGAAVYVAPQGKSGFTKKTIAPHSDAAASFLGSENGCGGAWKAGTTADGPRRSASSR